MRTFFSFHTRSGQAGIVILLLTVVLLSAGVSIVSRTTSDLAITGTGERGNQALDGAESGAENALSQDLSAYVPPEADPNSPVSVTTQVHGNTSLSSFLNQGEVSGINLTGVSGGTTVTVMWGKETVCGETASVVFSIFNTAGGATAPVRRTYVGPASCSRGDNFVSAQAGSDGFFNQYTLTLQSGDVLLRIRPLYFGTDIQVAGAGLPVQSYTVTSVAQNKISKETKAVQLKRTLPSAPSLFDYVLFSGTSISN